MVMLLLTTLRVEVCRQLLLPGQIHRVIGSREGRPANEHILSQRAALVVVWANNHFHHCFIFDWCRLVEAALAVRELVALSLGPGNVRRLNYRSLGLF